MTLSAASVVPAHLAGSGGSHEPDLYTRLSLELETRFRTREATEDAVITLGPGGRDARLSGELTEGTADRLARLLDEHRGIERIHLTSEGGLTDEGAALGQLIARYRLATYVPDYCVSACTLAFVRGRERFIAAHARLGFHAPYEQGLFGQDFPADSEPERAAYLAAGVEAGFVDAALKVRSEDLWIPDADRLLAAHVATAVVDLHRFPDSTLDDGPDLAHARTALLRNFAVLQGVARAAPERIDAIAALYLDAYRSGVSEGTAVAMLKRLSAAALIEAVRGADDGTVTAMGRYLVKAMRRADDAQTCLAIGGDADLITASEALGRTGEDELRRLVDDALARRGAGPGELERTAAVFRDAALPISDCAGTVRRYGQVLAQPPRAAASALRAMWFPRPAPPRLIEATARP